MQIVVSGLWHLGCVTAACLAEHYDVIAHDPDRDVVARLQQGVPPLYEPKLVELIDAGRSARRLRFSDDAACAGEADLLWVTYDTPVDANDVADVDYVAHSIEALVARMRPGTLIVISSQVPVGFIARMERAAADAGSDVRFAYVPENLRLGEAIEIFRRPERIIAGVRNEEDRNRLGVVLTPFSDNVIWMSPESAEMTKHALNAFLATSVTFINEIAGICEHVGADVKDVERGLKSESRIGPRAYLSAGSGFAGGTLARDVVALTDAGARENVPTNVLSGVLATNATQQRWADLAIQREIGAVAGSRIAVLGLTYKAGTDTLRRSSSVEFCKRMRTRGATVTAYDPAVRALPDELRDSIGLLPDVATAIDGADALVVGTEWPELRSILPADLTGMRRRLVIDPKRWLEESLGHDSSIRYLGVGRTAQSDMRIHATKEHL